MARAGLSLSYSENQACGLPATRAQSYDGAVIVFTCDTPQLARYVTLDIDPSSPDVTNALLQMGEVTLEEITSGECSRLSGKINMVSVINPLRGCHGEVIFQVHSQLAEVFSLGNFAETIQ